MKKGHTTRPHIPQRLLRWKRILSGLTLTLVSLCAIISLLYLSGVLSEVLEMSTLFALFTAVFSILVPCCICLTLITLSEPARTQTPAETQDKAAQEPTLTVDILHGTLSFGEERIRCRQQILLILQHMTSQDDHYISKDDFASVLDDSSYTNDSDSANAKINTLVSAIRGTLRTLPFEIVNVNRRGYVLERKNAEETPAKAAAQS